MMPISFIISIIPTILDDKAKGYERYHVSDENHPNPNPKFLLNPLLSMVNPQTHNFSMVKSCEIPIFEA
jgi:hypothetical protein